MSQDNHPCHFRPSQSWPRVRLSAWLRRLICSLLLIPWLILPWEALSGSPQPPLGPVALAAEAPVASQGVQPARTAVSLTGFTHEWQTSNNCGPATLATVLNYLGGKYSQQTIAQTVRPNPNDQNVRPDELARFAIAQGFQATLRVNGNDDLLRHLLSNGIPVLIETWESDNQADLTHGFAHFRLLTGYDDTRQWWIAYDSYFMRDLLNPEGEYQGMTVPFAQADQLWRITNRKYVLVYTAEETSIVKRILGPTLDDAAMWQGAVQQARAEIARQPDDPFAWFNLGSSLYGQGKPEEAMTAFLRAQQYSLPTRMMWYQYEPLETFYATGRYQELIGLANQALMTATGIEELHYWKALALAAEGELSAARDNLQEALQINANYAQALSALDSVPGG